MRVTHEKLGSYYFYYNETKTTLFTNNVTNEEKVFGRTNPSIFVKDAFNDAIIRGENLEAP